MTALASRIPAPNDVIGGKYRVESQVGEGGMAVVLAATHEGLRQKVAIKVIHPQYAGSPELKERFFREARALALINSPHVARIFDVGTLDGGAAYLVLEYLEGLDLHRLLERDGALSPAAAAAYLLQASEGLAEAHVLGILHRDLKPSNLFLVAGPAGEPCIKLLDFGLAKLTEEGVSGLTEREDVMGSPSYMAPEQIRGLAQADARSDVWSLGVTLYELLTNAFPFEGATPTKVAAAVLTEPPIPLLSRRRDVPPALSRAVMECLIKEPERRMASAKHLADALRPFANAAVLPSFARTTAILAGVKDRDDRPRRRGAGAPPSSEATMRMAPSEPTYGGMMPLAPESPREELPSEPIDLTAESRRKSAEPPVAKNGGPDGSHEAEAETQPHEDSIRTLVRAPSERAPSDRAPVEPKKPASNERTEEPTLVRIDRFGASDPRLQAIRPFDVESLAAMHRRRRAWLVVSATLVLSAVVLLILLRGR